MLDLNLSYEHHIKSILNKVNKTISLLRKFQLILPRYSLITIYRTFVRPHLGHGDVIYDCAFNESFHQRLDNKRDITGEALSRTRVENLEIKTLV